MKKRFDSLTLTSNLSIGYLKKYSHIRICENVGYLFMPKSVDELGESIQFAAEQKMPVKYIGGASNILFGDCRNMILILENALPKLLDFSGNKAIVSANTNVNSLIMQAAKQGLGGLEFLSGIPAHIGGCLKMNAGAFGKEISSFVNRIKILTNDGLSKWLEKDELIWSYRKSSIENIILEAEIDFEVSSQPVTVNKIHNFIKERKCKQPLQLPNLGCIFKNPQGQSAGKLIEECGLKGKKVHDAQISLQHANFFINNGNATFSDMVELIRLTQDEVRKKLLVNLELEIEVIHA
jgi:UDP-N-acetylmuramate dehydrogenase